MINEDKLKRFGFDPDKQRKAKSYHRAHLKLNLIEAIFSLALLLSFAWFGSVPLSEFTQSISGWKWINYIIYVAIFSSGFFLLSWPFDWWGYRIEHTYNLSNQNLTSWLQDQVKGNLLSLVISVLILPVIFIVIDWTGLWWLVAAIGTAIFTLIIGYLNPILLMPIFYDFEPLDNKELAERLKELADKAGVGILGVYKMEAGVKTKKAIGALTGLGATRRIILSDTLLNNYSPDQIETVIAHELGHHVHNDMPKGVIKSTIFTLIGFYIADILLPIFGGWFGLNVGISGLPLLLIILGGFFHLSSPITNTLSRIREEKADKFALQLAQEPVAQGKVFVKLSEQNLGYADPHPLIEAIFLDHPAPIKRVKQAFDFKRKRLS